MYMFNHFHLGSMQSSFEKNHKTLELCLLWLSGNIWACMFHSAGADKNAEGCNVFVFFHCDIIENLLVPVERGAATAAYFPQVKFQAHMLKLHSMVVFSLEKVSLPRYVVPGEVFMYLRVVGPLRHWTLGEILRTLSVVVLWQSCPHAPHTCLLVIWLARPHFLCFKLPSLFSVPP